MRYKIIRSSDLDELEDMVDDYLDFGLKPIGGIFMNTEGIYHQTMYSPEEKSDRWKGIEISNNDLEIAKILKVAEEKIAEACGCPFVGGNAHDCATAGAEPRQLGETEECNCICHRKPPEGWQKGAIIRRGLAPNPLSGTSVVTLYVDYELMDNGSLEDVSGEFWFNARFTRDGEQVDTRIFPMPDDEVMSNTDIGSENKS